MTIIDDVCEKITKIQSEESEDLTVTRMIETIFIGTHAASHLPLSYLSEYDLSPVDIRIFNASQISMSRNLHRKPL